jgi:predicted ATPase/class 3 adenylate cyclase
VNLANPLPSGAVTFLFTDIEGSTRLLAALGDAYEAILDEHRRRIREAVAANGGHEVNTEGDALFVVFAVPSAAIAAAAQAQRNLAAPWPGDITLRVRMGIHTGEVTLAGDDYVGIEVHRAARIGAAGHGGQVLLSSATRSLVEDRLPAGVTLRDLGEHRLKDLSRAERLAQLVIDGLRNDFPPPRTLDATPNNLPVQLTSFVGREGDVSAAERLLERTRLLTLTGPGGTGKTRLALQVAAEVADRFPDGVHFVPLAAISDPSLVLPAIATAVGVDIGGRAPLEAVGEGLAKQRRLLVLDNFEQVLGAASDMAQLLRMTEHLKLVVTSRAVLRISGEQEQPVPPLELPDPHAVHGAASLSQFEAVRLFIERGVAARPDFEVTNENAPAVAEITARLDGLPLAIELAAARLRLLSPQAILARLGDRLALLSGGARDLPERQQTLRAAIAWSYDLLDAAERDLFERVGVFMGGWTLEAAEAICADGLGLDVFEGLGSLSEKSLVRPQEDSHGDARFLMLETIRDFSVERFVARPDAATIRDRHAAWFLGFAEDLGASLGGDDRGMRLLRLDDDHDNLRAALTWFMNGDALAEAARMAVALWRFWQQRGHLLEARQRIDAILATDERLHLLEPRLRMALLKAAGGVTYWQGEIASTHTRYKEALDIARAVGTRAELAEALYNFSFAPVDVSGSDDPNVWFAALSSTAPPVVREAAEIYRELGDQAGEAKAYWGLGTYLLYGADYPEAEAVLLRGLDLFRALGDRFGEAWTYHSLGLIQFKLGQTVEAVSAVDKALALFVLANDISGITLSLLDLAGAALELGRRDEALRFAAASDALATRTGAGLGTTSALADVLPPVPRRPTDQAELRIWNEGAALSLEQATTLAQAATRRLLEEARTRGSAPVGANDR